MHFSATVITSSSSHIIISRRTIWTFVFKTPNRRSISFLAASWRRLSFFSSSMSVWLIVLILWCHCSYPPCQRSTASNEFLRHTMPRTELIINVRLSCLGTAPFLESGISSRISLNNLITQHNQGNLCVRIFFDFHKLAFRCPPPHIRLPVHFYDVFEESKTVSSSWLHRYVRSVAVPVCTVATQQLLHTI